MEHVTDIKHVWQTLVRAFLIGITLLDTTFRNAVVASTMQRACTGRYPSLSMVKEVYIGTSKGASIRDLLVDICVIARPTLLDKLRDPAAEMHRDFVSDLLWTFFTSPLSCSADEKPWLTDPHRYLEAVGWTLVATPSNLQWGRLWHFFHFMTYALVIVSTRVISSRSRFYHLEVAM